MEREGEGYKREENIKENLARCSVKGETVKQWGGDDVLFYPYTSVCGTVFLQSFTSF